MSAIAAALIGATACGYRLAARSVPAYLTAVEVAAPDVSSIDEPTLAPLLRVELNAELARRGVSVARGHAPATLRTRALALTPRAVAVRGGSVGALTLALRLEGHLVDEQGRTLWRSGFVEVTDDAGVPLETLAAESARERAVARLARRGALELVDRLQSPR